MKAVCFVFPLLENTHGPKLPGFVRLTAAGAGRGAGGGLVLAGDAVAPGSGGPGGPWSPGQAAPGCPELCLFIFHQLWRFGFHCAAGRKTWDA